ncbi:MAG: excisionase family DNA-binding protein [Actinomycetota bacterium]
MPRRRLDRALLCSVDEAAESLGVSRSIVFRLIKDGRLRSVKIHKRRLIPLSALDEFVADLLDVS